MWQRVEYRQPQGKRSSRKNQNTHQWNNGESAGSNAASAGTPPRVSANQVNGLVKDLRRSAHALRFPTKDSTNDAAFFFRDTLWPAVRHFIEGRYAARTASEGCGVSSPPLIPVRLVGLGIGPFSRRESRSSFLQMATLLALRDSCVDCVAHLISARHKAALAENAAVNAEAPHEGTGSDARDHVLERPVVTASFFEPLAVEALHGECCRRLGVTMEQTNQFGAYSPRMSDDGGELLILFMPHCPWVLMHNTLLANWPTTPAPHTSASVQETHGEKEGTGTATTAAALLPLRNLLLIGNDIRNAPLVVHSSAAGKKGQPWSVSSAALISLLHFKELFPMHLSDGAGGKRGKRRPGGGALRLSAAEGVNGDMGRPACDRPEDYEEGSAGLTGLSRSDVVDAFLDTAVMSLAEGFSDAEVREKLYTDGQGKSHAVIRKAPELFDMVEIPK